MATTPPLYPPTLSQQQFSDLVFNIKDYQLTHGMLLKYGSNADSVHAVPVGVSVFPTLFPRSRFEDARQLQMVYNKLYARVAEDEVWLFGVLGGLVREDEFARTLWRIYLEVKREGYVQDVTLGLFRSDYMVHVSRDEAFSRDLFSLKQVEFNTYSIAGGTHANRVADMHKHLTKTRTNCLPLDSDIDNVSESSRLPENHTIASLVSGLVAAHDAYGPPRSCQASSTGILFVVQPRNMNICDERPLEYALWNRDPPIPVFRVVFGEEVLSRTSLTDTRELLYQPLPGSPPIEISVAYLRAGSDPDEYTPAGISCRMLLESSRAIKCPSILGHLATFKKVQQALATPNALTRFLPPAEAELVANTFAPMYPMDHSSDAGKRGRALACNPKTAVNHVLKPSLEGGGHNVYRGDILAFLDSVPVSRWHTYVLMELINPVIQNNILLSPRGTYTAEDADHAPASTGSKTQQQQHHHDILSSSPRPGPTISELGIFGVCLWRSKPQTHPEILENRDAGWSFKTKPASVDEMSVVKGFGCFDCPYLVDEETYGLNGSYST